MKRAHRMLELAAWEWAIMPIVPHLQTQCEDKAASKMTSSFFPMEMTESLRS